ncbi:MAG TPA: COG1615 family transporter, partial [Tissierellia bacterium]|nr:COG1615 family transporter [Tissierellia bacterium]
MKKKGKFFLMGIVAIIFIVLNSFGSIVRFVTDYLWFKEVGYTETFFTKIKAQFMIGVPIFILLSILLFIFIRKLRKTYMAASD